MEWWNPGETSWLVKLWQNPGGNLVEPPDHPAALEEIAGTLVEPSWTLWNLTLVRTLVEPWRNPSGTVKPSSNQPGPPRSPRRNWWNPAGPRGTGTLPQTTPDLPAVVEPWWKPRRWWNPGGTGWNLSSGCSEPSRSLSGLRPQSFQLLGKNNLKPVVKN